MAPDEPATSFRVSFRWGRSEILLMIANSNSSYQTFSTPDSTAEIPGQQKMCPIHEIVVIVVTIIASSSSSSPSPPESTPALSLSWSYESLGGIATTVATFAM